MLKINQLKNQTPQKLPHQRPDGTLKLIIQSAKAEDIGNYRIEVINKVGKAVSSAPLKHAEEKKIEEPKQEKAGELPKFERELQPQTVKPGETAVFEAKLSQQSEAPKVQWYKDDKPINASNDMLIDTRTDGTLRLIIQRAQSDSAAVYRVEVINKAGKATSSAPLKYAEEKKIDGGKEENVEDVKPFFVQPLKTQAVKEGDTVILECRVNEDSHPEVQWYRDDIPIDTKPNILIEHRPDGTLKLTVRKVRSEDIGEYKCVAVNRAGKAQTEAPLKYAQMIDLKLPDDEEVSLIDEETAEEPQRLKVVQDKNTAATEGISNIHAEYVMITGVKRNNSI
uniref:Ig-like domain-containing protein n=1 Tax=Panagrolaimus superbus TaxID=310955 RepID=A0A914Z8V3_9BILA